MSMIQFGGSRPVTPQFGLGRKDKADAAADAGQPAEAKSKRSPVKAVRERVENFSEEHSGLVLTGGGGVLEGMSEIAEQIFDLPIRRGTDRPAACAGCRRSRARRETLSGRAAIRP